MSNPKVNSTMVTQETESCDTLKSETNAENVKNPLNTEGSGVTLTKASMQNLPDLRFHRVYGEYIKMSPDYCTARLEIPELSETEHYSFTTRKKYLAFSSRPIAVDEKVCLFLETDPMVSMSFVRIGLTNCYPNNVMNPKSCSGMYNYLNFLRVNFLDKVNTIQLYMKQSEEVTCFVNDVNRSHLFENVNIKVSFRVVIELNHGVKIAKFINSPEANRTGILDILSIEKPVPLTTIVFVESFMKIFMKNEREFKKRERLMRRLLPSTSDTPVELIQPVSSTDVKNKQKSIDSDVTHFAKIVEHQLNRIPEDKRMKCMQKILESLDTSSR